MKCQRCGKQVKNQQFCQACKNVLLPYYENTKDWQMAYEIESFQRSVSSFSNASSDIEEHTF